MTQQKPVSIEHCIAPATGNLVLLFSEKLDLLVLTPEAAVMVAVKLLEDAKKSSPQSVAGITWGQRA